MTGGCRWPAAAVIGIVMASGCAPHRMALPSGPWTPASDGAEVLAGATAACRDVRTLTAEIAVRGRIAAQKVRGRLSAGVAAPASVRIEAVAPFGPPVFIFVATGDDATLLLPRDGRVLEHGRPDAVLDAVAGVPLGPAELRHVLSGCPTEPVEPPRAAAAGPDWRSLSTGSAEELYVNRERGSASWRLVAIARSPQDRSGGWRAEYQQFDNGLPRLIHLSGASAPRFDLDLTLSQVDVNTPLAPEVFRVRIPKDAVPISIEELRRSGPLADRTSGR